MNDSDDRAAERRAMVAHLGISHPRVAAALRAVRRHAFVPVEASSFAYEDEPLGLGYGDATISAPHMVALMLEEADLHDGDLVLEVGGGMGTSPPSRPSWSGRPATSTRSSSTSRSRARRSGV